MRHASTEGTLYARVLDADGLTLAQAGQPAALARAFVARDTLEQGSGDTFAISNLPPGTAERIAADVQAVAADPAIGPRLAATGQQLDPGGTAEFAAAVDAQRKGIATTAKALGIQPTR